MLRSLQKLPMGRQAAGLQLKNGHYIKSEIHILGERIYGPAESRDINRASGHVQIRPLEHRLGGRKRRDHSKKPGETTITVTADKTAQTCKVTVKQPTVRLDRTSASLYRKGTLRLSVSSTSKSIPRWKTNKKSVATVDNEGRVTAVKTEPPSSRSQSTVSAKPVRSR